MQTCIYKPFDKFILRSPFFPLETFINLFSGKNTSVDELKRLVSTPVFQEAIYLASPELYNETQKWLKGNETSKKESDKLLCSLVKYFSRMCMRCTPFGLFAGFCTGTLTERTSVILKDSVSFGRQTRFDMNYLCALAQDLQKIPGIRNHLLFYPNTSIYKTGNKYRYVEYRYNNAKRKHFVVAIDETDYLNRIMKLATNGAPFSTMADILTDGDITIEDAENYIYELIESQVLISDLEPSVTTRDFIQNIITVCRNCSDKNSSVNNELQQILFTLESITGMLRDIDKNPIGSTQHYYTEIEKTLNNIKTKFERKFLFQTDMKLATESCNISKSITDAIYEGVRLLNKFTYKNSNTNLKQFCDAFYERYEEREIPLTLVLDPESGIGYKQSDSGNSDVSPLINDIAPPVKYSEQSSVTWQKIYSFLLKKYIEAVKYNKHEIEITDSDITKYFKDEPSWDDLPDTFSVMAQVIETQNENNLGLIKISSCGGSSAANLLGRFCHADEKLYEFVKEITEKEKELNPDYLLVEIAHLPEARTGNVILRPVLRDYEIPYLAKPSVDADHVIRLNDLMISVRAGTVLLRSKKHNKIVIPHLSNAHNYSYNSLPVYNFLCDLQSQGKRSGLWFDWGLLAGECNYLPRVRFKNIILSPATWVIQKDDIKPALDAKDDEKMFTEFQKVRENFKIPSYILLEDGDNELFLNLDNLLCVKTLFSLVKNRNSFKLQEFLFNPEKNLAKGQEGNYTNQTVVCFYKEKQDIKEKKK